MGSIVDCYDNAIIEAFWSRMQVELLDRRRWTTRVELANAIFEYWRSSTTTRGDTAHWAC
jgi:transposase InsO family protein